MCNGRGCCHFCFFVVVVVVVVVFVVNNQKKKAGISRRFLGMAKKLISFP